jgi:hypothetical protein
MKIKINPYPKIGFRRKVNIKIDNYDTYNMYTTLAQIIYPMLVQLKETKHGVPADFAEVGGESYQSQYSFDFYEDHNHELFDERIKLWDEVLDKMIWSFQQLADDNWHDKYYHGEAKYEFVDTEPMLNPVTGKMEVMHQMVDTNPDEHWYDSVGVQLHQDRIQEGLDLFAKYYMNLWD